MFAVEKLGKHILSFGQPTCRSFLVHISAITGNYRSLKPQWGFVFLIFNYFLPVHALLYTILNECPQKSSQIDFQEGKVRIGGIKFGKGVVREFITSKLKLMNDS